MTDKTETDRKRPGDHAVIEFPRRDARRRCVRLYAFFLHALLVLLVWLLLDPSVGSRLVKFLRKSPAYQPEYWGMVAAHRVITGSLPNGAVVFLGDSRMRELDLSAITNGPVYNLSIGGDTTRGLGTRLHNYHHLDRCRLVVLGTGVNDLSHFSDEESLQDYEAILNYLKDSGVRRVAVCSVLPIDETIYEQANAAWLRGYRTTNARIASYNCKLQNLCARYPIATFMDVNSDFTNASGNLRPGLSADGLHLTEEGNQIWTAALKRTLPLTSDH